MTDSNDRQDCPEIRAMLHDLEELVEGEKWNLDAAAIAAWRERPWAGADVVMVDTAIKDGMNLFDALTLEEIKDFIDAGHDAGMKVALAGSIGLDHVDALCELAPDIIGVCGAVCDGLNRKNRIIGEKVARLYSYVRSHAVPDKAFAVCGGAGLPLNPVI